MDKIHKSLVELVEETEKRYDNDCYDGDAHAQYVHGGQLEALLMVLWMADVPLPERKGKFTERFFQRWKRQ